MSDQSHPRGAAVTIRELDTRQPRVDSTNVRPLDPDTPLLIGREGQMAIGIDPVADTGVSRQAALVTTTATEWVIEILNRHGAWVHLWGQRPLWVEAHTVLRRVWPRIGIRIIGGDRHLEHWLLLESGPQQDPTNAPRPLIAAAEPLTVAGQTDLTDQPEPLTPPQMAAVRAVFAQHLAWPPVTGAAPRALSAVANRQRISESAVAARLRNVQQRAYAYGLHEQTGVSDPEYVYLLVRHGYLPVPDRIIATRPQHHAAE